MKMTKRQMVLLRNRAILIGGAALAVLLAVLLLKGIFGAIKKPGGTQSASVLSSTAAQSSAAMQSSSAPSQSSAGSAGTGSSVESTSASSQSNTVTFTDPEFGELTLDSTLFTPNTFTAQSFSDANGFKKLADANAYGKVGIDVSAHQGEIDWNKVAAAGVDFVMLRACYRGYGSGTLAEDTTFAENAKKAAAAGLKIGVYVFSQAISEEEAKQEAEYLLSLLAAGKNSFTVTYPVVYDWEHIDYDDARTDAVDGASASLFAAAFCKAVSDKGYKPMVYMDAESAYKVYDLAQLSSVGLWYSEEAASPRLYYRPDMWQYSLAGTVDGISGTVDLNLCFTQYP